MEIILTVCKLRYDYLARADCVICCVRCALKLADDLVSGINVICCIVGVCLNSSLSLEIVIKSCNLIIKSVFRFGQLVANVVIVFRDNRIIFTNLFQIAVQIVSEIADAVRLIQLC